MVIRMTFTCSSSSSSNCSSSVVSWSLMLLLLALLPEMYRCASTDWDGEITPKDPIVENWKTLVVNCTITHPANPDMDRVYFKRGKVKYQGDMVRQISANAVQLRLPNVHRNMTGGTHIFCYKQDQDIAVDHIIFTVADKPTQPNITGCRVYNWERMTCWWEPEVQTTGIDTNQTLLWTVMPDCTDCDFYKCPHPSPGECTWVTPDGGRTSAFKMGSTYMMSVHAINALVNFTERRTYSEFLRANTSRLVEPAPVSSLEAIPKFIGHTSALVHWKSSKLIAEKPILYQVVYKPDWSSVWQKINTTRVPINLTNLVPYSEYTVRVSGIPLIDGRALGFWSKNKTTTFQTLEDVPGANPSVVSSSFQTLPGGDATKRRVKIYWQNIPKPVQHGRIEKLIVRYKAREATTYRQVRSVKQVEVGGERDYANITLARDTSYEVTVTAATKEGINADLQPDAVIIGAESLLPAVDGFVAQGNDSGIYLKWHLVPAATVFTVFWCKGSLHDNNCEDGLKWTTTNSTSHYIPLDTSVGQRYQNYIVAVSVETDQHDIGLVNSGMIWSDCIHNMNADLEPPRAPKLSAHQPAESMQLEWEKPRCQAAYVAYYVLSYCEATHCSNKASPMRIRNNQTSYILEGLKPDVTYQARMLSVGADGHESSYTEWVEHTVKFSGLRQGQIAGIVIGCLIVVALVLLGLYSVIRYCKKYGKSFTHIEIKRPDAFAPPLSMRHLFQQLNGSVDQYGNVLDPRGYTDTSANIAEDENLANYNRERHNGTQGTRSNGMMSASGPVSYKNLSETMDSGCGTASGNTTSTPLIPEMSEQEEMIGDDDVFSSAGAAPANVAGAAAAKLGTHPGYDTPKSQRQVDPEKAALLQDISWEDTPQKPPESIALLDNRANNAKPDWTAMPPVIFQGNGHSGTFPNSAPLERNGSVPRSPKLSEVSEYSTLADIPNVDSASTPTSSITPYSLVDESGKQPALQPISEGSMSSSLPSVIEPNNKNNGNNNNLAEPLHASDPKLHQQYTDFVPNTGNEIVPELTDYQDFHTVMLNSAPQSPASAPWDTECSPSSPTPAPVFPVHSNPSFTSPSSDQKTPHDSEAVLSKPTESQCSSVQDTRHPQPLALDHSNVPIHNRHDEDTAVSAPTSPEPVALPTGYVVLPEENNPVFESPPVKEEAQASQAVTDDGSTVPADPTSPVVESSSCDTDINSNKALQTGCDEPLPSSADTLDSESRSPVSIPDLPDPGYIAHTAVH